MAGKSRYSDDDRTRVNASLTMHDGNIRRTARDTSIPISTVRLWKREWEEHGVPAVVEAKTAKAIDKFVGEAIDVRDSALARLKEVIPQADKVRDLATVVGILDDKIVRAQGRPTTITENQSAGMNPRELAMLFGGVAAGMLEATRKREGEIIDADVVQEIPASNQANNH